MVVGITARKNAASAKSYHATDEKAIRQEWGGRLLAYLDLDPSDLGQREFNRLVDGKHPETNKQVTQRLDPDGKRVCVTDLTFNVPKSVSLARQFGLNGDQIIEVVNASIRRTMEEVVEPLATTRVRIGGKDEDRPTGNILYRVDYHELARPVQGVSLPHDHGHAIVFNMTKDNAEGRVKALKTRAIHENMPKIQAAFLKDLRQGMENIGYRTVKKGKSFELAGVSRATVNKFSERRKVIKGWLKGTNGRGKGKVAVITREPKQPVMDMVALKAEWVSRLTKRELNVIKRLQSRPKVGRGLSAAQQRVDRLRFFRHPEPATPVREKGFGIAR